MIIRVSTKKELKQFIHYVEKLYDNCELYTYPIFWSLKKELTDLVLKKQTYKALLSLDKTGKINGRVLYTFAFEKRQKRQVCYFSFFDTINDAMVVKNLFSYIENEMKKENIQQIEGPFAPYDPDTRRGVLVDGYELDQTIFHSYNYAYYDTLLTEAGFYKKQDTLALNAKIEGATLNKLERFTKIFNHRYDVEIKSVNFKQIDKDIDDVAIILKKATDEQNYQAAPTKEEIREIFQGLKIFLDADYIKIARDRQTHEPLGFCLVMLDYNKVFKKTKGKINILKLLKGKKKIKKVIGKLQYVIPEYQKTGLIAALYYEISHTINKKHITEFEAGTILENNERSYNIFLHLGGKVTKRFRIYQRSFL